MGSARRFSVFLRVWWRRKRSVRGTGPRATGDGWISSRAGGSRKKLRGYKPRLPDSIFSRAGWSRERSEREGQALALRGTDGYSRAQGGAERSCAVTNRAYQIQYSRAQGGVAGSRFARATAIHSIPSRLIDDIPQRLTCREPTRVIQENLKPTLRDVRCVFHRNVRREQHIR